MIRFIDIVFKPNFNFDKMHVTTDFLVKVANDKIILKHEAIAQLKERGLDKNGKKLQKNERI